MFVTIVAQLGIGFSPCLYRYCWSTSVRVAPRLRLQPEIIELF